MIFWRHILRPWCWCVGHRRGKLVGKVLAKNKDMTYRDERVFRCPRCSGNERRYKVKPQPAPASESQDEAFTYGRNPKQDEQEDRRLDDPRTGQAKALNRKYE